MEVTANALSFTSFPMGGADASRQIPVGPLFESSALFLAGTVDRLLKNADWPVRYQVSWHLPKPQPSHAPFNGLPDKFGSAPLACLTSPLKLVEPASICLARLESPGSSALAILRCPIKRKIVEVSGQAETSTIFSPRLPAKSDTLRIYKMSKARSSTFLNYFSRPVL